MRISALIDADHQIGHSYFIDVDSIQKLHFVWYHKIIPLLKEYFYNDGERLQVVIGEDFIKESQMDEATRRVLGDYYDPDSPRFSINHLDEDEFQH